MSAILKQRRQEWNGKAHDLSAEHCRRLAPRLANPMILHSLIISAPFHSPGGENYCLRVAVLATRNPMLVTPTIYTSEHYSSALYKFTLLNDVSDRCLYSSLQLFSGSSNVCTSPHLKDSLYLAYPFILCSNYVPSFWLVACTYWPGDGQVR